MRYPPIYLVRHGQTEWNRDDKRQGRKESPLTERGMHQSKAVARLIFRETEPDTRNWTLVCSPQPRAVMTARVIAHGCRIPLAGSDERLMEIDMGSWEGLSWSEIRSKFPASSTDPRDAHFTIPDGETYDHVAARARSWLESVRGPTIAVSHGVFGRVLRTVYLEMDQSAYASQEEGSHETIFMLRAGGIEAIKVPQF